MNDLDRQIQLLIDQAPQDGITPQLVTAIAPILKLFAQQLHHSQYYILQTLDQDWLLTTLQNNNQPDIQKTVLYAFSTLKDVALGPQPIRDSVRNPELMTLPVPVIDLLFQFNAIENLDSIIFFEIPGDPESGAELQRAEFQRMIQMHLQGLQQPNPDLPPDIA